MEMTVLKRKMFWGSVTGLLRVGLAIPIYMILTPFVLKTLGLELFGIWSLNTIIISFLNLTDFGFKTSLVYFVAKENRNPIEINKQFNAVFWIILATTILAFMMTSVLSTTIVRDILLIPEKFHHEAIFVLTVTMGGFGIRFLAAPYQSVIEGHQEIYYSQLVSLAWLLFYSIGTILALLIRPDIYALGWVMFASNLIVFAGFYFYVRRHFPFIKVSLGEIKKERICTNLKYGAGIQIATLMIVLREPIYKVLIARAYGLSSVAVFEIVYKLCTQLISVVASPLLGVMSSTAMLSEREHDLEKILKPFFGYALSILVPAALFFESFSQEFIEWWLGSNVLNAGGMLSMTFIAFAIYYISETLYKAIQGSGMSSYSGAIQVANIFLNIGVFLLLSSKPPWSVPISILVGFFVFSLSNFLIFKWRFKEITLIRSEQLIWVVIPAFFYILIQFVIIKNLWPFFFSAYLIFHLFCVRNAGIFDWFGIAKEFFLLKVRQRVPN